MSTDELILDCSNCPNYATGGCEDCVVGWLIDRPEGAIVFDVAEERAIRALAAGGLLPDVTVGRTRAAPG